MSLTSFIGRNIGRLRIGQSYILIFSALITALSTTSYYLDLPLWLFIVLAIGLAFLTWFAGYISEKKKIIDHERETFNIVNLRFQKKIWEAIITDIVKPMVKEMIKEAFKELGEEMKL